MMFGFSSVSAQQVSLQEAIKQALQNKAEAKKAALQVKKAEYKIDEAKAGALPQISATAGLTYNPILQNLFLSLERKNQSPFGQPWNSGFCKLHQAFLIREFLDLKQQNLQEFYVLMLNYQ
jgi:hypothetical protein